MSGLTWWAQKQWVDRQRKLWRQHDARLAAVWRDAAELTDIPVDVPPCPDAPAAPAVVVLPGASPSLPRSGAARS